MKNKKPNIIFITIDGLRARNLSCYDYKRKTSPNIDSLAKQGILFKNFFSSYNCTHKSFLSILSGRHLLLQDFELYPSQREMKSFFDTGGILFPEILQKQGYKTFFLRKLFGWQKIGFDYYFKQDSQESSTKWNLIRFIKKIPLLYNIPKYILHNFYFFPKRFENKIRFNNSGEMATNEAIDIIKQNKDNKFFLWLHYTDTHVPHIFPYSFNNKFIPNKKSEKIFEILESKDGYNKKDIDFLKGCWKINDTVEDIIAKYDAAIFYDDFLVGKIIDTLKEENLLKDTIIFIFTDHGTSLGEHEAYFSTDGLYDVSFNIPLIIFGKGIPKNKKIDALTQSKDLAPTILDLIGIKYDSLSFDGKSLFPLLSGKEGEIRESIFIEEQVSGLKRRAIRTKKYKYVESPEKEHSICKLCNTTHGDLVDLHDLENDPDENINLAPKNKKLLNEMKKKLNKTIIDLNTLNEKRRIRNFINKSNLIKK
ncbi:MAG: sulfatase-like hydrolase/transferase [Nanoarchaeota archaeon]|nr:sulfatase-like hydrolase/transferase [Nanoarchaeota archaeon]